MILGVFKVPQRWLLSQAVWVWAGAVASLDSFDFMGRWGDSV